MPLARCTVTGPAHVFVEVEPAMEEVCQRQMLGLPLREAFPEPEFAPILALYDIARMLGRPVSAMATASNGEDGIITLEPGPDRILVEWMPTLRAYPAQPAPRDRAYALGPTP